MNAQVPQQQKLSVEVTDDGWYLHTHRREYFSFEKHHELMLRVTRDTRRMAPPVVEAYLEKLWDEKGAAVVGRIVKQAQRVQRDTPE